MIGFDLLHEIVYKHRKAAGLSRVQLADLAGVGKTVIFDVEKGKKTVQLDTLLKILIVLNVKTHLTSPLMNHLLNGNENS